MGQARAGCKGANSTDELPKWAAIAQFIVKAVLRCNNAWLRNEIYTENRGLPQHFYIEIAEGGLQTDPVK